MKLLKITFLSLNLAVVGCTKIEKTFTVIWKNEDQILKIDEKVPYGKIPFYNGPEPVKLNPNPLIKNYKFLGWDKEIAPIEQDTTYNAIFSESEMASLAITFNSNSEHNTFTFLAKAKVDWGDETRISEESSHTFDKNGEYIIRFFIDDLSSIKIEDGLNGINSLYFADFIDKISPTCFRNCPNLKSVRLPNNLSNLNAYMFYNNKVDFYTKINDVYYLGNESNDHLYCFGTTNEEEIHIVEGCEILTNNSFEQSTNTKTFSLPSTLKIIGNNTFENCNSLSNLIIPENVESIGEYAFKNCYQLENINIPKKIKIIKESCFENCSNLKSIIVPNGINEIESYAFYSCVNLNFVDLSTVDHFIKGGEDMFIGCANDLKIKVKDATLKSIYENDPNWKNYTFVID